MWGALAGDIIGSVYEGSSLKTETFPLFSQDSGFTDDSVLTVAVAAAILKGKDYGTSLREYGRRYPNAGYGGSFFQWLFADNPGPYNSWGNGSAMRVSPVGLAFDNSDLVLREAEKSAAVTHNHPEGIKGACAVALSVYLARNGADKKKIKQEITRRFDYDLSPSLETIRPHYSFDLSCQGSVPEALICFLESRDYEDAVRKAVSLGGDSDTQACITGAVAHSFYGKIPDYILQKIRELLPTEFLQTADAFCARYHID
ncbi:MAG: ADP-ribosylglycohydrolase family protein [Desulfurivibrionaceae bacterium]